MSSREALAPQFILAFRRRWRLAHILPCTGTCARRQQTFDSDQLDPRPGHLRTSPHSRCRAPASFWRVLQQLWREGYSADERTVGTVPHLLAMLKLLDGVTRTCSASVEQVCARESCDSSHGYRHDERCRDVGAARTCNRRNLLPESMSMARR
jgi:hypothetical protein